MNKSIITAVLAIAWMIALARGEDQANPSSAQSKKQQQQQQQQQNNQSASGAAAANTQGGQTSAEKPLMVVSATTGIQGTVTDIGRFRRTITIKSDDGAIVTVKAGKEVTNFDEIKKGDRINMTYHAETVIALRKSAGAPSATVEHVLLVPEKGAAPSAAEVAIESSAVIEDVDYNKRTIRLKAPDGKSRTIKIGDDVQNLNEFQKGDQVAVRTTEAVAMSVIKRNNK